jgi:hypothetical protein
MNAGMAYGHESHIGPPSDLINIADFIQEASDLESTSVAVKDRWNNLSEDRKTAIATECR